MMTEHTDKYKITKMQKSDVMVKFRCDNYRH